MSTAQHPETATRREFAAILGCKPGYVTQLIAQGRAVLTPDGKRVMVAQSRQRIEDTRDPSKQGVADRHAAARGEAIDSGTPSAQAPSKASQNDTNAAGATYQQARAVKERFFALEAKRAYEEAIGKLLDAQEVEHAVVTAITAVRTSLQNLCTTLAPVMAAVTTEEEARAEMSTHIEQVLSDLSNRLAALSRNQT